MGNFRRVLPLLVLGLALAVPPAGILAQPAAPTPRTAPGAASSATAATSPAPAQKGDEAELESPMPPATEAHRLYEEGRYAEAVPHAERALAAAGRAFAADDPLQGFFLQLLANVYRQAGRADEAIALFERAVALNQRVHGAASLELAASLNSLGVALLGRGGRGDGERALALLQRSLALREAALAADAPEIASSLGNLAAAYDELGRAAEALPLHERALALSERVRGPDDARTATALNNLAETLGTLGRFREALPLHRRALAIRESRLGPGHPETATSLNNLGDLLDTLGRPAEALPMKERAYAVNRQRLGAAHPATLSSMGNLAYLLAALGRFDEALALAREALETATRALGPDAPAVGSGLLRLAYIHQQRGEYAEALPLARSALAQREAQRGAGHPDTAVALNNLAELHAAMGDYGAALALHRRALQVREASFGAKHPETASGLNNLASLYQALGQAALAEPLLERALAIHREAYGPDHAETARSLNNLGHLLAAKGAAKAAAKGAAKGPAKGAAKKGAADQMRAKALFEQALAIQQKALGPTHPTLAVTLNNLAGVLEDLKRAREALPLHERALALRERGFGARHPSVALSLNNLAALHDTLGQPARALPLYRRALAILQPAAGAASTQPVLLAAVHTRLARWYQSNERNGAAAGRPARDGTDIAIFHLKQAVNLSQGLRAGAGSLDAAAQASLLRSVEQRYRRLAELLVRRGRLPEAEQVLALLKQQERREFVRGDAQDAGSLDARAELSAAERELAASLAANAESLSRAQAELEALGETNEANAPRRAQVLARIQADSEALDGLLADAAGALADAGTTTTGAAATTATAATAAGTARTTTSHTGANANAGRMAAAFESAIGERDAVSQRLALLNERSGARAAAIFIVPGERQTTFLLVTAQGAVGLTGGLPEARLNTLVAELRRAIEARRADYRAPAAALHQALIGPVAPLLARARIDTLMLYLVGSLRYLPVAALVDARSGQHLVERYALAVYTVGGLRDALAEPPRERWAAAGLGVSRALAGFDALPSVPGELLGVVRSSADAAPAAGVLGGVLGGERFLDEAFTRERLGQVARRGAPFAVLHVATHFKLVPGREDESQLLLGDGDLLSLRQLRSDATLAFGTYDLVTLSACNTSMGGGATTAGDARAGAEFEGLATTLMKKGARAVMATLWEVQDQGTARLMRSFYEARGEQRRHSKAEALRAAQRAMLKGELRDESGQLDFRHPYYWAGFILMGNWL
ncbi:MAG: tetratricopeptide repeat protein [Burkholderiales bacterium]|nr:tetratricopeptide repeat protein [Burkholderiales bacterium]